MSSGHGFSQARHTPPPRFRRLNRPMLALLQPIAVATVLFAATNADDLVLLIVFFAQPGCRPRQVVLGSSTQVERIMTSRMRTRALASSGVASRTVVVTA